MNWVMGILANNDLFSTLCSGQVLCAYNRLGNATMVVVVVATIVGQLGCSAGGVSQALE